MFRGVIEKFHIFKQEKSYLQLEKTLVLIGILIDNSEKKYDLSIDSLITKEHSDSINLIIVNEYSYASDYSKKKEVSVPLNATLYQLKKALTKEFNYEVEEIKLSQ